MGRRPQPAAVRSQKAAVRSERKPKPEALAEAAVPESGLKAPAWLKGEGLEIWKTRGPMLRTARLLGAADELAFARYCRDFALWIKLRGEMDKPSRGYTYESESAHGKLRRVDPDFMVADRVERQLLALEDRFGLNPSERQRLFLARSQGGKNPGLFDEQPPARAQDPATPAAKPAEPRVPPSSFLN